MSDPETPSRKTFNLRLTKFELTHVRDLFSVLLPTEMKETLSQRLAQAQNRSLVEAQLWQKLVRACTEAELPMGDEAPDFVVSTAGVPPISVFEVAHDPAPQSNDDDGPVRGSIFDPDEEDDA